MRNYTAKSAFTPPQQSHSYKRSDRLYPQPMQQQQRNVRIQQNTIIQKRKDIQINYKTQTILSHQIDKYRYHFTTKQMYPILQRHSQKQIMDATCIWYKQLDRINLKKKTFIKFLKSDYLLSDWIGDQFPNIIYVNIDGILGYFDINNKWTNRVCALLLSQIDFQNSQNKNYQLRYRLNQQIEWQIPQQLTYLKMGISLDDQDQLLNLPLPQPITLSFQIYEK